MNNTFKVTKFNLVLGAIVLQVVLALGFYLSSLSNPNQDTQIKLTLKPFTDTSLISSGKITLDYEISTVEDYNSYGTQNYNVGDTVYMSLYPMYDNSNAYNYGSLSKDKPQEQFNFEFSNLFIKGKVVEVIAPEIDNQLVPKPLPQIERNYTDYYSSSYSSSSYDSSPSDYYYSDSSYSQNSSDYYYNSSLDSGYYNNNYSSDYYATSAYPSNYYKYKIVYGIEDYQLDQKYISELPSLNSPKAEISINKEGEAKLKNLVSDNKKWPQ